MYIVINGGGKVGSYLARSLTKKGHDIAVIERREDVLDKLEEELPHNILLIRGDGCDVKFQEDAGTGHADIFLAVTGNDDDNLVSCQLAKVTFNVQRTIARINSPKNEKIFNTLGIEGISSTTIISRIIEERTSIGDIIRLYTLKRGKLALVELEIIGDDCPACVKPLSGIRMPKDSILVTVMRGEHVFVPRGDTLMQKGDQVIAVTAVGREEDLRRALLGH